MFGIAVSVPLCDVLVLQHKNLPSKTYQSSSSSEINILSIEKRLI